jgi:hypothetical protein
MATKPDPAVDPATPENHAASPRLELPPPTAPEHVDSEIFAAWKEHMIQGYQHNSQMFSGLLNAFMRPYWQTVWMYRLMFFVGILGFVLAAALGATLGIEFGALFGGLTVAAFLAFFVSRPLQSLEQNIILITWLGLIYNTYWTRLMYANDPANIQAELEKIIATTIEQLQQLTEKQAELSGKRPSPDN